MKTIIILLGTILASNSAFAQDNIYEWTGKDGVVVYSSQPPPAGTSARERTLKPVPIMGSAAPQPEVAPVQDDQELTPAEQAQKNREELSRKRIEATSYEEALAIECDQARNVMEKLQKINNLANVLKPGRYSGKNLTLIEAFYRQHLEGKAMASGKTTNKYFRYLFASWDCACTRIARHGQMQLQYMYATGPI